jgi:hypothetical protein
MNLGLPDYAAHVGTKEWLVRKGWITDADDDRFLNTVLHFRHAKEHNSPASPFRSIRLKSSFALS